FGWFIDPTPNDNREFGNAVSSMEWSSTAASPAAGRIDLYTVVLHELGHVIGLGDDASGSAAHSIMETTLNSGTRRTLDSQPSATIVSSLGSVALATPPLTLTSGDSRQVLLSQLALSSDLTPLDLAMLPFAPGKRPDDFMASTGANRDLYYGDSRL